MSTLPTKVRVTCTGTRPLLMHNVRMASPLNDFARRLAVISAKKKKTDEDRLDMARIDWEGSMYHDPEIGPYLPAQNLFRSLVKGAALTRAGKQVERGLVLCDWRLPVQYKGSRSIEALWGKGVDGSQFVDLRSVRVGMTRIDRCRPIFNEWSIASEFLIDQNILDFEVFERIADAAGRFEGIGDYRSLFGRYSAAVEQI